MLQYGRASQVASGRVTTLPLAAALLLTVYPPLREVERVEVDWNGSWKEIRRHSFETGCTRTVDFWDVKK